MSEEEKDQIDSSFLDEYLYPKRFGPKFWVKTIFLIILVFSAYFVKTNVLDRRLEPEELKKSIEIFDISSHWVITKKINEPDYKGIVLVPEISFRVRNKGTGDLQNVLLLGVFRLLNASRPLGESYKMLFNDPFSPGSETEKLVFQSAFGYRATSEEAFSKNSRNWRSSQVEIYVKSRNSGMVYLTTFYINRKIEGADLDIKVL